MGVIYEKSVPNLLITSILRQLKWYISLRGRFNNSSLKLLRKDWRTWTLTAITFTPESLH